jgi:hypothetical protein
VLVFGTQIRGFAPGRSHRIFRAKKILSTPSFGGEVKPLVPRRSFTACKRSVNATWKSEFRQNSRAFPAHSSTFGRWVFPRGDTRGEAWWRKLERLTQIAQQALKSVVRSCLNKKRCKCRKICLLFWSSHCARRYSGQVTVSTNRCSNLGRGKRFFSSPELPEQLLAPPKHLLINCYRGPFPRGKATGV